jgi:hypothetical protein
VELSLFQLSQSSSAEAWLVLMVLVDQLLRHIGER